MDDARAHWQLQRLAMLGDAAPLASLASTGALALKTASAAISLISDGQQRVLAYHGPPLPADTHSFPFCLTALQQHDPLLIADARADARWAAAPGIGSAPHWRLVAACPLGPADASVRAVFWIADPTPRVLDARERALLQGLGSCVAREVMTLQHEAQRQRAINLQLLDPAAHQMRGALTSIHGFSEFLLHHSSDEAQRKELLGTIYDQAHQLDCLVNELVELAHLRALGAHELQLQPQSAERLLRDAVAEFSAAHDEVRIALRIDPQLPALLVDAKQIRHALLLMFGYEQREGRHGSELQVSLQPSLQSGFVALRVHDPSLHVKSEEVEHLFEPFHRSTLANHTHKLHLGLAPVQLIAQLHGGSVSASAREQGLVITLQLPTHD